jgi:PST family polysaccharide transporter
MIKSNSSIPQKDYFSTEHLKAGLKTRALRGASLTVIGQLASFIIETTGTIILARLLTPHDFGLVTMVVSLSLLLQSFGANGFVEAVVQSKQIDHKQISTLFWINAGLSFMHMLFFMASAPNIVWFYKEPLLKPITVVMAVSILFGGLSNQHMSLLTRNMHFMKITSTEFVARLISISTAVALAWWGWEYWALVAKWVLSPLIITVGVWIICGWRPGPPARGTGVRPMLKFAFHTYGNFIMSYFRRNIDKMLVGRSFGTQELGYYDRAYHLSNMVPVQILSPLNSVSVATFSRLSDEPEKYRRHYLTVLSILAFVGMPVSAILTINSHDIIFLLLGPRWDQTGQIFSIFGLSIGVAIIYITHGWLHLSLGTPDRWFKWSIIEFIVTMLCITIGLKYGAMGIAAAFTVSFYILLGPALWYAGKTVKLQISSVLSTVWKYFASALVAGLLSWFFLYSFGLSSDIFLSLETPWRIAISSTICILIYLILLVSAFGSLKPLSQFISIIRETIQSKQSAA